MSNTLSPARVAANQANAALSTGPKTAEGKANSSRNAVTTALTGRTVLLSSDDEEIYNRHLAGYDKKFKPLTEAECALVQSIADTDWRLNRIPHLLMALYSKGREDFAEAFLDLKGGARDVRVELETYLKYEKQFRNLNLQESRLHRRRTVDVAELRTMQKERDAQRKIDLDVASKLYLAAQKDGQSYDPADHGFEFSTADIHAYLTGVRGNALFLNHVNRPLASMEEMLSLRD